MSEKIQGHFVFYEAFFSPQKSCSNIKRDRIKEQNVIKRLHWANPLGKIVVFARVKSKEAPKQEVLSQQLEFLFTEMY